MGFVSQLRKNRESMKEKVIAFGDGNNAGGQADNRFWKLTRDKTGTGSAVIRFLPPVNGDELPWVKVFSYAFQGPTGKWYINDSPTTIGGADPVFEDNARLYNTGFDADKKLVKDMKRSRKTSYIYNILVIKDPANPENEGKVFLFKGGKQIHDMITDKAKPKFEDDTPVFVYDLWEGANFKLRIVNKDKYPTYENSMFESPTALFGGDEDKLEAVLSKCHRLGEFTDASHYKSYDQLKKEFDRAMIGTAVAPAAEQVEEEEDYNPRAALERAVKVEREVQKPSVDTFEKVEKATKVEKVQAVDDDFDSDQTLDYFARLLQDT